MQKQADRSFLTHTTARIVLGVAVVVFVSAAVLLGALGGIGYGFQSPGTVFSVSALLALAAAPSAHWLVYQPARQSELDAPQDMSAVTVTDPLTQILNRHGITMGVLEAMAQAERYNTPLSIAMVDVDRFQRINDQFDQRTGDKVLTEIAGVLADSLRMPDKVGRYGGEEFMVVLPHTGLTQARKIAERIRTSVAGTKFHAADKRTTLTVSVGVTQYVKGADLELLLARTNGAVAEAKRGKGNRVVTKKGR